MKKVLIFFAIPLLPLLAAAYDLEQQYNDTAKQLNTVLTKHITADYRLHKEQEDNNLYKQVINILNKNKAVNHSFLTMNYGGTTSNFACYLVDDIRKELEENGLAEQLKNDIETLNEIANHITSNGYDNKYETLLTVGVNPIEAGLRLEHDKTHKYGKYVDEALTQGQITYRHYELQSSTVARITNQVIYITVTEAEVEEIQKNLTELNTFHRPQWMQNVIKDFKHEVKQTAKGVLNHL